MKKTISLFTLIFIITWVTNAQTERYHRLRSLGTSLEQAELDNACNNQNFNHKPLANWNVTTINPLINRKIYKIFVDDEIKYYWVERSFSYPTNDDGESIDADNILEIIQCPDADNDGTPDIRDNCPNQYGPSSNNGCPIIDSDNDGVPDNQDNCPNEAGPSSNNGCPITGNADLVVDLDYSEALVNDSFKSISSSSFYTLYLDERVQMQLAIRNQGNATSGNSTTSIYASNSSSYASNSATLLEDINFSNINTNNHQVASGIEFTHHTLSPYVDGSGNVYLHIVVDKNDDVDEGTSGENNNIKESFLRLNIKNDTRSYNLKVIGLWNSQTYYSGTVSSIQQEQLIINNLGLTGQTVIVVRDNTSQLMQVN